MFKSLLEYFDFRYFLRFSGLFFLFYFTYSFVHAASIPSGIYYPFVEKYLNFPVLIRYGVLYTAQLLLGVLGYTTFVVADQIQGSDGFTILQMAWACYGLGLKSFWVAFVCAHQMTLKNKMYWSIIGVLTIFLLNCIRVVVMMVAAVDKWSIADYLGTNAHDLFNYLCYAALIGLIFLFYAKTKTNTKTKPQVGDELTSSKAL